MRSVGMSGITFRMKITETRMIKRGSGAKTESASEAKMRVRIDDFTRKPWNERVREPGGLCMQVID
jgi:hypothetical protein